MTKKGETFYKARINLYVKLTVTKEAIKTSPVGLLSKVGLTKK
jgi:hypothetical protein